MIFIAFLIGLGVPAVNGWLALRLLEGNAPVLAQWERWAIGSVLGFTLSVFVQFALLWSGLIGVNFAGTLAAYIGLLLVLGVTYALRRKAYTAKPAEVDPSPALPSWARWLSGAAAVWIAVKICTGGFLLTMSPPYFDDVINNWNFRAKALLHAEQLTLELNRGYGIIESNTVSSYPPSMPLIKANLSTMLGWWSEGLVNMPHILWYMLALVILFWQLRWRVSVGWSLLGTYLLSSIPLYLMHGSVAYADLFVSIHILVAVSVCHRALTEENSAKARSLLLIAGFTAGLTAFTKNEGVVLLAPLLSICIAVAAWWRLKSDGKFMSTLGLCALLCAAVAIPWVVYKWTHGLGFGNAKDVSGLGFGWQTGVLSAVLKNSFLTGGWLLLFPVTLLLLLARWRTALRSPAVLITGFLLLTYGAQMVIFLFTSLSVEAIYQTGYGRGVIQLLPTVCLLITLLLRDLERTVPFKSMNV